MVYPVAVGSEKCLRKRHRGTVSVKGGFHTLTRGSKRFSRNTYPRILWGIFRTPYNVMTKGCHCSWTNLMAIGGPHQYGRRRLKRLDVSVTKHVVIDVIARLRDIKIACFSEEKQPY